MVGVDFIVEGEVVDAVEAAVDFIVEGEVVDTVEAAEPLFPSLAKFFSAAANLSLAAWSSIALASCSATALL